MKIHAYCRPQLHQSFVRLRLKVLLFGKTPFCPLFVPLTQKPLVKSSKGVFPYFTLKSTGQTGQSLSVLLVYQSLYMKIHAYYRPQLHQSFVRLRLKVLLFGKTPFCPLFLPLTQKPLIKSSKGVLFLLYSEEHRANGAKP